MNEKVTRGMRIACRVALEGRKLGTLVEAKRAKCRV